MYDEGKIEEVNGLVRLVKPKKSRARDKSDLIPGTVVKLTENFGFVRSEDLQKDIFVSGKYMMGAIPGIKCWLKKYLHIAVILRAKLRKSWKKRKMS